jgi:hypothetical protein
MDIVSGRRRLSEFLSYVSLLLSMSSLYPYILIFVKFYFLLVRRYFTNWTVSLAASQPGWVLGQFMYAPPGSEQQAG